MMKWSELFYTDEDFYIPYDENQKAIRGYWLTTLGVDLENIPDIFQEQFDLFPQKSSANQEPKKVFVDDIVGTSYSDYGGLPLIESYLRIKRAPVYISRGDVTQGEYSRKFRKPVYSQSCPIILSRTDDGKYYVDRNGNHRVIFYKLMMLSQISKTASIENVKKIKNNFWVNALINE